MYETINSPINYGGLELKNRIIFAPTTFGLAEDEYFEKIRKIAAGGCAMVIIGDVPVGKSQFEKSLFDKKGFAHYQKLVEIVHSYDCRICAQLHQSDSNMLAMLKYVPGVLTKKISMEELRPLLNAEVAPYISKLSTRKIHKIINGFGEAAVLAVKAGFDMVQVHGDRMCGSFSSTVFNHRTDEYGQQSVENSMRFAREALTLTRRTLDAAGYSHVELIAKLNGSEIINDDITPELLAASAKELEKAGIALITVNGGGGLTRLEGMSGDGHRPEGWKVKYAEIVKNAVSIPVAASGNLKHPSYVDAIIREGKCDLVALGRTSICDPHWVNKCKAGREDLIRYCLSCMHCVYALPADVCGCTMNPRCRREAFTPRVEDTPQTGAGRKVVVVGAGPAGCLAAITLAQRGFRPILCDKNDLLGGMMVPAGMPIGKQEFQNGINYYANMLRELKVDVRLNTEVTPALLQAEAPYAVIAAVGSYEFIPPIPGADGENVIGARRYILERPEIRGKKVVVLGCGQTGLEAAHMLAALGNDVTEIEMQERAFITLLEHKLDLEYAEASGVKTVFGHKVLELTDSAVVAQSVETGEQVTFAADVIIPAIGVRSNSAEVEKLRACGVEKFFNIGDSAKTGMIYEAISAAYDCAIALE